MTPYIFPKRFNEEEFEHKARKSSDGDSVISNVELVESEKQCHRKSIDGDNVISTVEPVESEKQCHRKSSDGDNMISTVEPESESDKPITDNTFQREFSRIVQAIDSLGETVNKKLNVLVTI